MCFETDSPSWKPQSPSPCTFFGQGAIHLLRSVDFRNEICDKHLYVGICGPRPPEGKQGQKAVAAGALQIATCVAPSRYFRVPARQILWPAIQCWDERGTHLSLRGFGIVTFRRLQPARPLRDIVESIWIQEDLTCSEQGAPSCVVPTGTIEVLFHYGDRLSHLESEKLELMPRSYVTGQRSRPVFTVTSGRVGIVLVSLFPWGLRSLFPECTGTPDGYVDLGLILGHSRIAAMEERLRAAPDSQTRVRWVESFLMAERTENRGDIRMIVASQRLATSMAPHTVHRMARELSMSRRHFARAFRSTIGLQPKTFSRIMRFQKAIRLHRDGGMPWATIAGECGYSDQAHLSHEIKTFSARTPRAIELARDQPNEVFNGSDVSEFFNTVYL